MKKLFVFSLALLVGCKMSSEEVTTTAPVENPYPSGGVSLLPDQKLTSPRFRFHDGTIVNNAPNIIDQVPNLANFPVSEWFVAQWKKSSLLTPDRMNLDPNVTDPFFGKAFLQYYSEPFNGKVLSEINVYRKEDSSFVYELTGRGGWLDTGGGSNLFLSTESLVNGNEANGSQSLEKRIDLNFKAKIKERLTEYYTSRARSDGSVVSQFFSGFTFRYHNPDTNEDVPLFVQITHADSRIEKFMAPRKLEYKGCYTNDAGQKQIVYGANLANSLGGNGFIAGATPNEDLKSFSFNLNDQICNLIKTPFNCQNGTSFSFPQNAKDLKNWQVGSFYIGIETQEALALNTSIVPTVAGPAAGQSSLTIQLKDLELVKYPAITRLNCDQPATTSPTPTPTPTTPVPPVRYCTGGKVLQNNECHPADGQISVGQFCSGGSVIAYQCGGVKPMSEWIDVGNGCFHLNTGVHCN